VKQLQSGKTNSLHLTSTRHTDTLVEQVRGMPEIEHVYMEDTDITVVGMRHLGTLPNLKSMMVYNRAAGDAGMLELRNCTKLEQLMIYDQRITDHAIAELHTHLPNVSVSTKHHEDRRAHDLEPDGDSDDTPRAPDSDAPSESK
jgi:hypothetical protein